MKSIIHIIKEEIEDYFNNNFWKWFGDSKVVDASGKPLVVYHGTSGDFDMFKKFGSQTGHPSAELGYYFTANRSVADRFTKDTTNIKPFGNVAYEPHRTGANIMFVYLSIQNPKILTARKFMDLMVKDDYSGIRTPEDYAKIKEDLIAEGYDGIIISPTEWSPGLEEYGHTQFIAFYPEQIKSATGNSGEFSPSSSDITKESLADKFAEKEFNIKNPEYKAHGANMGELVVDRYTTVHNGVKGTYPYEIYMNPKSLNAFDSNVRAIIDDKGNFFVSKENNYFSHGDLGNALSKTPYDLGVVYAPVNFHNKMLINRIGDTNKFGLSDNYRGYAKRNPEIIQKLINTAKQKNPQFEIIPEYWEKLKYGWEKI